MKSIARPLLSPGGVAIAVLAIAIVAVGTGVLTEAPFAWYGDIPGWLTSATVLFAALQYLQSVGVRREEADAKRREHANALIAYLVTPDPNASPRTYGVVLTNASDAPFHDVQVSADVHGASQPSLKLELLTPGTHYVQLLVEEKKPARWAFPVQNVDPNSLQQYLSTNRYGIREIRLKDRNGLAWLANGRGALAPAV